ncbi:MAG: Asp23/Gls24 family envelope stress response protein [Fervidobacterium sp.]
MGYVDIKENVYQEIAFRSICELLGIDKDDKNAKNLKKGIVVEKKLLENSEVNPNTLLNYNIQLLLQLSATFGTNLIDLANRIAYKVRDDVKSMTATDIVAVNVKFVDIESPNQV